jgi:hypothetical protein
VLGLSVGVVVVHPLVGRVDLGWPGDHVVRVVLVLLSGLVLASPSQQLWLGHPGRWVLALWETVGIGFGHFEGMGAADGAIVLGVGCFGGPWLVVEFVIAVAVVQLDSFQKAQ